MASLSLSRWLAPAVLAASVGLGALLPAPAQARDDDLVRVIVDVADVVFNGGSPYYRYGGGYGYNDRLVVVRDRYHRPTYYRYVPRNVYRAGPPYGNAYGYYGKGKGNKHRQVVRYDDRYYRGDRYYRDRDGRYDRRWGRDDDNDQGGRRWRRGRDD